VIKSRRLKWVEHVARIGRGEVYAEFWWRNLWERDHLKDSDVDGKIILIWIFVKRWVGAWTVKNWIRIETGGGHL
jgi:hypothetical protein